MPIVAVRKFRFDSQTDGEFRQSGVGPFMPMCRCWWLRHQSYAGSVCRWLFSFLTLCDLGYRDASNGNRQSVCSRDKGSIPLGRCLNLAARRNTGMSGGA